MAVRVLMLDDDMVHLELSEKFLNRQGTDYEIVPVETYDDAISRIDSEEFDAAICDIDLKEEGNSGLDVLEHIRSEGKDTPVIIFTGKSREEFAIQALNLGADYYLRKSATNIENLYAELSFYILTAVEKRRTKRALTETEIRAQTYLDTAGTVIIAFDKNLRITMANKKACEVLETTEEELVGKDWVHSYIPERDREQIESYLKKLVMGTVTPDEKEEGAVLTPSGEKIIEWYDAVLRDASGEAVGIIGAGPEITERRRTQEELRANEQMFRTIFEESPICIELFDSEGSLVAANKAALDLFGVKEEVEIAGFNLLSDPNIPDFVLESLKKGAAVRTETEFDFSKVKADSLYDTSRSGTLYLDAVFSPITIGKELRGYIAHIQDMSARHRAQVALRKSRERFKELYSTAMTGLFRVRASDSMILECNDQFAVLLGHKRRSEVVDNVGFFREYLSKPSSWEELKAKCRDSYGVRVDLGINQKSGNRLWVRLSLRAAPEKGFLEGVMADITQEKSALELLQKQKLELSEFAHSMSHDLKNICHNMIGFIELVEDEKDLRHLRRLKNLIHETGELLDHSVALAEAGMVVEKTEDVSLDALVRDVAKSVVPAGIEYSQDRLPVVRADQKKVAQIFRNLLDNAVIHGKPKRIEVHLEKEDASYIVIVSNDGQEIPDSIRHRVFQRGFTTGKTSRGFGLTIVKKIVDAHGWRIRLYDQRKTSFELRIPRND